MAKFLIIFALLFCFSNVNAQDTYMRQHSDKAEAVLYYHPQCSHCKTVMKYMNAHNILVNVKNTSNTAYRTELNRLGQRGVPVLVVNGRTIAGSTSIINYLKQNQNTLN